MRGEPGRDEETQPEDDQDPSSSDNRFARCDRFPDKGVTKSMNTDLILFRCARAQRNFGRFALQLG